MKRFLSLLLVLCMFAPAALAVSAADLMAQCDVYVASGDYATALASFELARMMDPNVPYDTCTIGTIYLNTGNTAKALECAQEATSVNPGSYEAWALMAAVCNASGDTAGAQQAQLYLTVLQAAGSTATAPATQPAVESAPVSLPTINTDELFARGNLRLVQQSFLPGVDEAPITISPDGKTGLFFTEGGFFLAKHGDANSKLPVQVSQTRGVQDILGKLQRLSGNRNLFAQARTPAVWSPDGRYVTMDFINLVYQNMQLLIDPFVIDTHTGEWIIFESGKSKKQDGSMLYGYFSPDSTKLYYAYYASSAPRCTMRCADLATGQVTVIYDGADQDFMPGWPSLFLTETGSLICLNDSAKFPVSMNVFRNDGSVWMRSKQDFQIDRTAWYANSLAYSAKSGFAVVSGLNRTAATTDSYTFKAFRIQNDQVDAAAFAKQYGLVGEVTPSMVAYDDTVISILTQQNNPFLANWRITCIRMSPCGKYALVACGYNAQHALLLVRLEDMACQTIALPDGLQAGAFGTRQYAGYNPGINWTDCGDLIIMTDSGLRLFTLE